MTIMALWKEALEEETVVQASGGPSFEGPFRPMGSMFSLSSVQMEDDPELHHWQLSSFDVEPLSWLRRKRLARVSFAWHALAAGHTAKRLIKKVCAQFHIQALVRKSFAALLQQKQRAQSRQMDLREVVDRWLEQKWLQQLSRALRCWRSKAAKGSILRRGGLLLKRFVDASCLRRWLSTWMANVVRAKRISEHMAVLEERRHAMLRDKGLKAWQGISRSAKAAHQVSDQKDVQLVQKLLKRWAATWRATRCRRLRLSVKCWRGFQDELRRTRCSAAVRSRCQDQEARAVLLRWDMAISLRKKETELQQILRFSEMRKWVRRWSRLKCSKALQAKRILGSTLQTWSAITGQLLLERQQREVECFGIGDGPTEWQNRQRSRWQRSYWNPWVQVVQRKRQRRRRVTEAKDVLQKLVKLQRLQLWHHQSREAARKAQALQRASTALRAMVSACRWARAHDCLVYWFTRTQAKRIMCKETDLSGETFLPLQPLPSMFAAPPWAGRPSRPPSWSHPSRSGPSEILLMSDDEVMEPALSATLSCAAESTTLAPVELLCSKMKQWVRFAFLIWRQAELSSATTSLPILQWAWSLWRQSRLRSQVQPLRWWALALQMHKLRELELRHDFRRLRRSLKAWYDAVAESLKEAVEAAQEELSSCRALFKDLHGPNGGVQDVSILEPVTSELVTSLPWS